MKAAKGDMMKQFKITKEWLEEKGACGEGKDWFSSQSSSFICPVIRKLVVLERFGWANWTITRAMTHEQNVRYACFSALQSIENFERLFPDDDRPRKAIEAALKWADNPTEENKVAAESAAWSAESAAWKKLLMFGLKLILGKVVSKALSI